MTIRELSLEYSGVVSPADFSILAAFALHETKEHVFREPERVITADETHALRQLLDRRSRHEPTAYITGEKEFFGLPFHVTRDTLIPRPETETLVEIALDTISRFPPSASKKLLITDIGTGSGAIIVSIASKLKNLEAKYDLHATDISQAAIDIAKENAKRHGVHDIVSFHHGNLVEPIENHLRDNDAVIIANLPYLSEDIYESASEDVRNYEPKSALLAEEDGLARYRALLEGLSSHKTSSIVPHRIAGLFEISPEQDGGIRQVFHGIFPDIRDYSVIPDLSGRSRIFRFSCMKK